MDNTTFYKDIVLEGEDVFSLECDNLSIIQYSKGYTFTTDAVILANIAKANSKDKVVDLGTGSGIIPLLLSAKCKPKKIYGIEIQPRLYDMAKRSVKLNRLEESIEILNIDIRNASNALGKETMDVVISNPPYMPVKKHLITDALKKNIDMLISRKNNLEPSDITKIFSVNQLLNESINCKTEMLISLEEIVEEASKLIKYGGKFYCIVKAERLTDLMFSMRSFKIEPKVLLPIQPNANKNVDTVIIEGKKNGKSGIKILSPLVIMEGDGSYTKKVQSMYYSNKKTIKERID